MTWHWHTKTTPTCCHKQQHTNECDAKDEAIVESEETETTTEYAYDYPILENIQKNETVEKGEDNSIETDDTDEYDSILDDIFYWTTI